MIKTLSQLGEFGFIDQMKKIFPISQRVMKGIGDDAAVVALSPSKYLLLTTDLFIENVHFTRRMDPKAIGHKVMSCNISDIAAMGGLPQYALISLGVPANLSLKFLNHIYAGIAQTAKKFGVSVVGGDTVKSDKIVINIALVGEVKKKQLVLRSGAKVGDSIFTTGPLGNSFKSDWHLRFTPRILESQYLVKNFRPTAMIDVSDGLAADLGHILKQSQVGAVIYEDRIPKRSSTTLSQALYDGEDFELIFTLSSKDALKLDRSKIKNFSFYQIGEIVQEQKLYLVDRRGNKKNLARKGYTHF